MTKWGREIKVIKDKDIITLTERSHIKAPFLWLLARREQRRQTGGKTEREHDKPAYLL